MARRPSPQTAALGGRFFIVGVSVSIDDGDVYRVVIITACPVAGGADRSRSSGN